MTYSADDKQAMIADTHDIAWNMIDDIEHMRETIAKPMPTSGDLRRMSNLLRRLLIDSGGDLRKIWPPRLQRRLHIVSPDVKDFVKSYEKGGRIFASVGASGIFGSQVEMFEISRGNSNAPHGSWQLYGSKNKLQIIPLKLDSFLSQPVLYYIDQWINRGQVIKYIANVAGGVHSGWPKEPSHAILERIRHIGSLWLDDGKLTWHVNHKAILPSAKAIDVDRNGIDFVLIQLMSAAYYLTVSPDIAELASIVRTENTN